MAALGRLVFEELCVLFHRGYNTYYDVEGKYFCHIYFIVVVEVRELDDKYYLTFQYVICSGFPQG